MDEAKHRQGDHAAEEQSGWHYTPEGSAGPSLYEAPDDHAMVDLPTAKGVEWTASEFVAHQKNITWYIAFAVVATAVAIITFIVSHDGFSTFIIALLGVIFGVAASIKPRVLTYHVGAKALRIGTQVHPYSLFKSFAVVDEGAFSNIMLVPYKRFSLPLNVYYPPEEEANIIQALAVHLPMQPPSDDLVERIMRRVHF